MRILFVTPYSPARLRSYGFIRYLSQHHEITVACIEQPIWISRYLDDIKPFCKEIHTVPLNRTSSLLKSFFALPSRKPMSVAYFASSQMHSLVDRLIHESTFDLIHTEFIRAAPYTAHIQGLPKLFDSVDSLTLAYERGWHNRHASVSNRLIALEEWLKMRHYEPIMIRSFDRVVVSSPVDQQYLAPPALPTVEVIPNGVDCDYFSPDDQKRDEYLLVFVGAMNYYVNHDSIMHFNRFIFPLIQKQQPNVRFSIVGANPKPSMRHWTNNPVIEVTGFVRDIRPYLSKASVFVCPMLGGSGIQNKLLQAMAMGTPIVTTSIACQALQVVDGEHVLIADEPQQFADAVANLLTDPGLQQRLSENARNYVHQSHTWTSAGQKLEAIYESMFIHPERFVNN